VKDISLEDDGTVQIESLSNEKNEAAKELILKATAEESKGRGGDRGGRKKDEEEVPKGPPPETGVIYRECEIVGVHNFGIFVSVLPGYEGLVHVSELDVKRVRFTWFILKSISYAISRRFRIQPPLVMQLDKN
jgi:polyribonucleotide nucleotidyltransferase